MKPEISANRCPSCNKKVSQEDDRSLYPFCSKRCKMVDLGKWFNEEYSLPTTDLSEEEVDDSDNQDI